MVECVVTYCVRTCVCLGTFCSQAAIPASFAQVVPQGGQLQTRPEKLRFGPLGGVLLWAACPQLTQLAC